MSTTAVPFYYERSVEGVVILAVQRSSATSDQPASSTRVCSVTPSATCLSILHAASHTSPGQRPEMRMPLHVDADFCGLVFPMQEGARQQGSSDYCQPLATSSWPFASSRTAASLDGHELTLTGKNALELTAVTFYCCGMSSIFISL